MKTTDKIRFRYTYIDHQFVAPWVLQLEVNDIVVDTLDCGTKENLKFIMSKLSSQMCFGFRESVNQ